MSFVAEVTDRQGRDDSPEASLTIYVFENSTICAGLPRVHAARCGERCGEHFVTGRRQRWTIGCEDAEVCGAAACSNFARLEVHSADVDMAHIHSMLYSELLLNDTNTTGA